MTIFTANLTHLLQREGWTTAHLGRLLGVQEAGLDEDGAIRKARRLVTGRQSPKIADVEALAGIFRVPPAELAWKSLEEK